MSTQKKQFQGTNFKKLYKKTYGDIKLNKHYTPDQFFELAVKYFEWAEQNAISSAETASFQGRVYQDEIAKPRIFTINGLSLFTGISYRKIKEFRYEEGYDEVMAFIDNVIYEQKFQLAVNGVINAGIIAKDLGIEKGANISIESNSEVAVNNVTAQEVKEAVVSILEEI